MCERPLKWIKKNKLKCILVILALFIISVIVLLLLLKSEKLLKASNIIQAVAIIILAVVTAYYANQTQKLVRETTVARIVPFMERRITEFCIPVDKQIDKIYEEFNRYKNEKTSISRKGNIRRYRDALKDIMLNKPFLCSIETGNKIGDLVAIIDPLLENPDAFLANYMNKHAEAKSSVTNELGEIQIRLRKINDMQDIEIEHTEK